jgi:sialate O-acetylesterase
MKSITILMQSKKWITIVILILLSISSYSFIPNLKIPLQLNELFSDHMVLQQNKSVPFWGKYTPNETITVSGNWGAKNTTVSDKDGNWTLAITTPKAGGPFIVNVTTSDTAITYKDVMIGEVWLASGQSNMEMPLQGWPPNDLITDSEREILNSNNSNIRMFTVKKQLSNKPLDAINGEWKISNPNSSPNFSATAYFFAQKLYKELKVPIGIINTSWGGTVVEAWTSKKALVKEGDFDEVLKLLEIPVDSKQIENWFSGFKSISMPESNSQWNSIDFDDIELSKTSFKDDNWSNLSLPGRFDEIANSEFDGAVWLRKKVAIEDVSEDYKLEIGAIDDMDNTYFNGVQVGGLNGTGFSSSKREYLIPKSILKKGENYIAIRAIDTGGPGSVSGPIFLSNLSGNQISLVGNWKTQIIAEMHSNRFFIYNENTIDFKKRPAIIRFDPNIPSFLFNAMINPLVPYSIKGAIWYQGESNVLRAEQYKRLFPALIEDWRSQWNEKFPFYFVQIAPFRYNQSEDKTLDVSQKLREAQRLSLKTEKTGMVVTLDIGNYLNIHPENKKEVGYRLAGLALQNDYDKNIVSSGPLFKNYKIKGNKIEIDFYSKGSGLKGMDSLEGFEIAGLDKKYVKANTRIVDDKIEVFADSILKPIYARYAWSDKGNASLFNIEGLPASSFNTKE